MLNAEQAATLTGASSVAVRSALRRLEDAGVLSLVTVGRRNRVWECHGLFALIDEFERRKLSGGAIGAASTAGAD